MPWYRERAYLEQLAADPYQPAGPVWMVDPEKLPQPVVFVPESDEVAEYGSSLESLAEMGFQVERKGVS